MARIRQNSANHGGRSNRNCAAVWLLLLVAMVLPGHVSARVPLSSDPVVWYATDDQPSAQPEFFEPDLLFYTIDSFVPRPFGRFWHPGRFFRRLATGETVPPAGNVNSLDEVVNSTWFTNRMGFRKLSPDELSEGPGWGLGLGDGPDMTTPMTITGAKTAGVTPGFRIKDASGQAWLLKFDPPSHPGMSIRSGVVANLIFHAIGFNTPVDRVVVFDREDLVVGEGAQMKVGRTGKVAMTEANLDSILVATNSAFGGHYHALASRYLDGVPMGPFDDEGVRADDANDLIRHENRRELRGLQVFAAWLNHFDTKMHNSLDMYIGEPGEGYVRHHLIDFASTLGAYGDQPVRRFGSEYGLDAGAIAGRLLTLGLVEDSWVPLAHPAGLSEVGLFDVDTFDPQNWEPDIPHSGMANLTARDGYWASKIISAFTDDDLRVLVARGLYQDPAAAEFLVATLAARRDKIVRYWFGEVPPLDHFRATAESVIFADLAVTRGYAAAAETSYRYRWAGVDSDRQVNKRSAWQVTDETSVMLPEISESDRPGFLSFEVQVNRGAGWSVIITAYFDRADGHIVAVDR